MIVEPLKFYIPPNSGVDFIAENIENTVKNGDVIAVSSKAISYSEGRLVKLSEIKISEEGRNLAEKYSLRPELAELILREAEEIVGGVDGFVLTIKFGMLCPNAGIDISNAPSGFAVLYPEDPWDSAKKLRKKLSTFRKKVGVVITDSRILPLRRGVSGVAISYSGIIGIEDLRGKKDIYGNLIRRTFRNVADMVANVATLVMGECDEMVPAVVLRNHPVKLGDNDLKPYIGLDECLYGKLINFKSII